MLSSSFALYTFQLLKSFKSVYPSMACGKEIKCFKKKKKKKKTTLCSRTHLNDLF